MADLEGDPRPGGLPDVDSQAVINVDFRHPLAVDEHPALRIVVDRDPIAPIEAQQQVRTGDQWVRHAHVGTKITPDNHVAARGEALLRPIGPNCQHRWMGSTHRFKLCCARSIVLEPDSRGEVNRISGTMGCTSSRWRQSGRYGAPVTTQ